ncbi:GNAT family N-acetyltransferase [Rothia uropygialis]|uniref:GNAT family N-acetyltransferase n=1 Tax=Kocuria sp. 36 TaxID=1415402 RepID=UPI00101CE156|nr:GNAT family N-acetyltransferase [Kocuria sp. 36]
MTFVCDGKYVISPAGVEEASTYTQVHLSALEKSYRNLIGPEFGSRMRAQAGDIASEDLEYLSQSDARAFIAWANPQFGESNDYGCCSVGADPDMWFRPVGIALAADAGPLEAWEREIGAHRLEPPAGRRLRKLINLYILPEAQNDGLGKELLREVLPSEDPAFLWLINGNEAAARFYRRHGFQELGEAFETEGSWAPSTTGRMVRGMA